MFCDKCNKYKHTSKYCCNKSKCIKCGEESHDGNCIEDVKCIHCGGGHFAGDAKCPKRIYIQRKEMNKIKTNRKKTFADLFYGISNEMPGENPENYLDSPIHFPRLGKRKPQKENIETTGTSRERMTPPRKRKFENQENQPSPGFRKSNESGENDIILHLLKNILQNLNIPIVWKDLIWNFIVPHVHQIIANITASFFGKFGNESTNL